MSIRFAAPNSPRNPLRCIRYVETDLAAANDNADADAAGSDQTLHAALRHFATHGLAAASEARREAEAAAARGDEQDFAMWRGICGAFDRRMARELDRSHVLQA